jgi:large subunit ribosomal protein L10
MPTEKKAEIVEQLTELLSQNKFIIAAEYRGLSVSEMSQLRRQLREMNAEFHVVKNTLAKFAAEKAGKPGLSQYFQGPIALALCQGDATQLAKALSAYARASKTALTIKGGILDVRVLSTQEIYSLATLPPMDVMRARLLGVLQGPIYSLHNVLSANLRALSTLLNARIQQMEGATNAQ